MFKLFSRYWSKTTAIALAVELGFLLGAFWAATDLRYGEGRAGFGPWDLLLRAAIFGVVVLFYLYTGGLYDSQERLETWELLVRLGRAFVLAGIFLAVLYFLLPTLTAGRGVFVLALALAAILIAGWRLLQRWILHRDLFADRVLLVGANRESIDLAREILDRRHLGYRVVGFVDDDPSLQGVSLVNPQVLGTTRQVRELAQAHQATRVVVALTDLRGRVSMDHLLECKTYGIPVEEGTDFYERLTGKIRLEGLRKSWLIFSQGFVVSPVVRFLKRLSDGAIAAVGLLLAAPWMLLTALAIRLDSPGPIFFRQQRVGLGGRIFTLYKFRSMCTDAEVEGRAVWAQENDPRITRVGRLLRKTRLDELPQLWNILLGDMSLVGPRPEREEFVRELSELNPYYECRLFVRPGLTGWAQIRAPYAATVEESLEKLQYDLYYVKNLSFALDLSILASTARTVLLGRGAR